MNDLKKFEDLFSAHDADRYHEVLGIVFEIEDGHLVDISCESKQRVITGYKKRLSD